MNAEKQEESRHAGTISRDAIITTPGASAILAQENLQ